MTRLSGSRERDVSVRCLVRRALAGLLSVTALGCSDVSADYKSIDPSGWDDHAAQVITPLRQLRGETYSLLSITAFTADSSGRVYAADTDRTRVVGLAPDGALSWQRAAPISRNGISLSAMGAGFGQVAVVDRFAQTVWVLDARTGDCLVR